MCGCDYYQELISRMLDEELSRDERSALAEHLGTCRECAAMYQAFSTLSDTISSNMAEPPEELTDNIMAEIRRSEIIRRNRRTRSSRPLKNLIAAAACAAVIVAAVGGVAIVNSRRTDAAVYESHTSLKTAADKAETELETASVDIPAQQSAAAAGEAQNADVQQQSAAPASIPDSENYGYVPAQTTPTPAPTQFYESAPVERPAFTPAPDVKAYASTAAPVQTPAPTPVVTPEPTPAATPEPTPESDMITAAAPVPTAEMPADQLPEAPKHAAGDDGAVESDGLLMSAAPENAAENEAILRVIDLRGIDTAELVEKLLVNAGQTDAADEDKGADEAAVSAATETPAQTPAPTAPETAEGPASADSGNEHAATVVSEPVPLDDNIKALLPEGIVPQRVDVINYKLHEEERSVIVCIGADGISVIAPDADGNSTIYTPGLTGEEYMHLLDTFVSLANSIIEHYAQ